MGHCHDADVRPEQPLVLVGNPNCGKSVVFHHLTGVYATVSNYPGTTLALAQGTFREWQVIDTPGVYGISDFTPEERITREVLQQAHIINVVNALHLERELFLTLQLADWGLPLVVVLNFMDEARRRGMRIDTARLAEALHAEVIPAAAVRGEGMDALMTAIPRLMRTVGRTAQPAEEDMDALLERRTRVDALVREVLIDGGARRSFQLAEAMVHPLLGLLIVLVVLFLAYQLVGVLVAQTIVGFTETVVMQGWYEPLVRGMVGALGLPGWLNGILVGEFGVLTMTVTYLLGILLPLVVAFYVLLSLLEDSGYLPRLAFLADRWLNRLGLNGEAVVPLILGFGCVTMATITTRMLDTERERTIASALLNFAIPCSAQLAVITALAAKAGMGVTAAYAAVVFACFVLLGTALHRLVPGTSSSLMMALPALQLPRPRNIALKTMARTRHFLAEAGIWFFVGALLISLAQLSGALVAIQNVIAPLTVGWMGLPKEAAVAYVMGIVRRDFGAAGFFQMALSPLQLLVALVSITLFVPCIAAILVLHKERGPAVAAGIWLGSIALAFGVGGLVFQGGSLLGW